MVYAESELHAADILVDLSVALLLDAKSSSMLLGNRLTKRAKH